MKINFNEIAPNFFEGLGLVSADTEKWLQENMDKPNIPLSTQLREALENEALDIRLKVCAVFVFARTLQQNLDLQNIHLALNSAFGLQQPPPQELGDKVH